MVQNEKLTCWCGNQTFSPFSEDYVLCEKCKTLKLTIWEDTAYFEVKEDGKDFYGKSYWFEHQENDLGYSSIVKRARTDMPERVLYWAKTLLEYKIPPGKALEIGCAHGGFVSLLKWIGFEASGLELSPWVTDFAHNTFDIPMYTGDIENQSIPPESLDVIIMMDVLEHLPDPRKTLQTIRKLLKPDGILMIQTPCFPETGEYEHMKEIDSPFLLQLKPPEHLFLFSKSSVKQLLNEEGFADVEFANAYFYGYDMFLVAGKLKLSQIDQEKIDQSLESTPGSRLALALFDIDRERSKIMDQLAKSEADREARLDVIVRQEDQLSKLEADRAARLTIIQELERQIEVIEADRAARLNIIQEQAHQIEIIEADRTTQLSMIQEQAHQIEVIEADRAARLSIIHDQGAQIKEYKVKLEEAQKRIINFPYILKKGKELFDIVALRNK